MVASEFTVAEQHTAALQERCVYCVLFCYVFVGCNVFCVYLCASVCL